MHNNEGVAQAGRRRRRNSGEFKAQAVAACQQPGVSMAAVALAHGINGNLLRRGVCERATPPSQASLANTSKPADSNAFFALTLALAVAKVPAPEIRIELQCGATTVKINWPAGAAGERAVWLRELLR
ncbi:transposase [Polaromonas sp.]|uniref:transposase n=1 Tax=Polaromonas sp. TaxID=1869339 RepID=UPI002C99AAE8|nr:transposase [Polaromonas sp.]HQS33531.1 transposase [Polaromonas sp.]HQS92793.1 transposase [Polaromonas sp.]